MRCFTSLLKNFGVFPEFKQSAWLHKTVFCMLILICSSGLLFLLICVDMFFCHDDNSIMEREFQDEKSKSLVSIRGLVYELDDFFKIHDSSLREDILLFSGEDATPFFITSKSHSYLDLRKYPSRRLLISRLDLQKRCKSGVKIIEMHGAFFDFSYIDRKIRRSFREKKAISKPPWCVDKSEAVSETDLYLYENLRIGFPVRNEAAFCRIYSSILISASTLIAAVCLIRFVASLQFRFRRVPETCEKFIIIVVPCYRESEISLRKTIDSIVDSTYSDNRKLLFIIVDGDNGTCPAQFLKDFCIFSSSLISYRTTECGISASNSALIYSGIYSIQTRSIAFILIIKVGHHGDTRSGNRGKRDSQLLVLEFFSRVLYGSCLEEIDKELYLHLNCLIGVHPLYFEFLVMVDADTEVASGSIRHLVNSFITDINTIGVCGETSIANKFETWVTMIQVYEYFVSHHLSKAFESLFGAVTCLPGCCSAFRLYSFNSFKITPLLLRKEILVDYADEANYSLYKKNLLSLGEDRYLTTLFFKYFPLLRTIFNENSLCKTTVPKTFTQLLHQRRRWINSTVLNLMELLFVQTHRGFCCFSLKTIVLIDLLSSIMMPSSFIYLLYLLYHTYTRRVMPVFAIVVIAATYGCHLGIIISKRRWSYFLWWLLHVMSIPIFSFIIPLYAFWNLDNFEWSN